MTVSLLLLFHPADATVAAGFLILAVCPWRTLRPRLHTTRTGNVAAALGMMVLLAGSSAIAAPVLLHLLLPLLSRSTTLQVDSGQYRRHADGDPTGAALPWGGGMPLVTEAGQKGAETG